MADTTISNLTEDTSPTKDDLVVIVNDPAGAPDNRRVTIGNFSVATQSHGCLYFSTPATTTGSATPVLAAGTTTEVGTGVDTTISATNRITYTGAATTVFQVTASVSITKASGGGSTLGTVAIAKNGTAVTGLQIDRTLANTSDEGAVSLTGNVSLATNDYVEIFVANAATDDMTVESGTLTIFA